MYPSLMTFPGDVFAEFDAIQRQLSRIFGAGWPGLGTAGSAAFPPLNVGSTEDSFEVYAFAPGLDPAKIEVSVAKGELVISGERPSDMPEGSDGKVYAQERFTGRFRRSVALPDEVDAARVEASYRNGVLRIVIARHESARPRRIEVKELQKLEHKS